MTAAPLAVETPQEAVMRELERAAPFAGLPAPVIKAIAAVACENYRPAGETIYTPGQFDGGEFFLVCEGRLKASLPNAAGGVTIEEPGPGDFYFLAETVAEDASRAEALTLSVEEAARLIVIDGAAFRGIVRERPSLTRSLMLHFAARLADSAALPADDSAPERRVFAELMKYVERDAISGCWRIARMPKHRELAEKAGADETVTAGAVARLIQEGVARREYPGLVIEDIARLSELAG